LSPDTPARYPHLDSRATSLLLACTLSWGLGQVAAKVVLADIPPLSQVAMRSGAALLLLLAWCRLRNVQLLRRDGTGLAGIAAGTLFALEFACIFVGLQYTSASRMTVFLYLSPFVVALGMPWIKGGEHLQASQWLGLGVAFAGVALAFSEGLHAPSAGPRQWQGDALGVAAAVFWGLTTLVVRATALAQAPAEKTLAYQLGMASLLLGLAALVSGPLWLRPWSQMAPVSLLALGFQAVVVTFASYLTWFWLIRHYPATRLASFTLLTPVAGLFFGVALLGEPLTPRLLLGLAGVVFGIAWVNRR
jgi:drug/metabolite transporter (DMT)-like permease